MNGKLPVEQLGEANTAKFLLNESRLSARSLWVVRVRLLLAKKTSDTSSQIWQVWEIAYK